jgi:starch phosphorylase
VWLNTPRKPLEASGTSGMKASMNGTVNVSIGDGWWAEGYNGSNGWLIDGGTSGDDQAAQDAADADALYKLLEEQVVPTYYQRDDRGIPHAWLQIVPRFVHSRAPASRALTPSMNDSRAPYPWRKKP